VKVYAVYGGNIVVFARIIMQTVIVKPVVNMRYIAFTIRRCALLQADFMGSGK
jgi:hypothetical protein